MAKTNNRIHLASIAQQEIVDRLFGGDLDGIDDLLDGPGTLAPQAQAFRTGDATQRWWLACLRSDAASAFTALEALCALVPSLWSDLVTTWTEYIFDCADSSTPLDPLRAVSKVQRATHTWTLAGILQMTSDISVWSRSTELASITRERLLPYDGQFLLTGSTHVPSSTAAALAHLEAFLGDHDAADRHYREAIAFEEQAGARTLLARTLHRYGEFTGDAAHTERAWELAREIGLGEAYLTR